MLRVYFFQIFIISVLVSCSSSEESSINQTYQFEDIYTFEMVGETKFPLDSVTSGSSDYKVYLDLKKQRIFAFDNPSKNRIYVYNYDRQKLIKFIEFQREGPEGIGQMEGFYIHTLDSIFIPSTQNQALYLVNQNSKIVKKYPYPKREGRDFLQIFFTSHNPATLVGNLIYCTPTVFGRTEKKPKNAIVLDLITEKWEEKGSIPDTYDKGYFAAPNFYTSYYDYNPDKDIYVHSFPIDNYVYAYDLKDSVKQYYAGSKYLKTTQPIGLNMVKLLFDEYTKYYQQSPSYLGVHYDKYRKLYYRTAQKPINDELIDDPDPLKRNFKTFSIVILDENLQKVGEFEFPDKYTYSPYFFSTPEGLLITNMKKMRERENEDYLYYDLFKIIKKNEK